MDRKLNIAFVWHMHQPLYKDPISGEYTMPWVLFHATKDYYDMCAVLDGYPNIRQTFNLVPCLIEQLNDYASGAAQDSYRAKSLKRATELTRDDKIFLLRYFFQANWENMIQPLPRYWELLRKRGVSNSREEIEAAHRYFSEKDYLDLQVLFNLSWIDPYFRKKDPFIASLVRKGGGFVEAEKTMLLDKQIEIVKMILPKYSEMRKAGAIEVSTTPYYHPIMPLLCDSQSAREAMPNIILPSKRFMHPEDAAKQMRKGVQLYRETFGDSPAGVWPSEGSVSMEMLPILVKEGIKWFATDEEILTNSLKRGIHRDSYGHSYDTFLYKPYEIDTGVARISVVFRDHVLSDLIGFDYSKMDPDAAAFDLTARLNRIASTIEAPSESIVSIILDGENAWENFRNDGWDFFNALYSRLSKHPALKCVTVNEFLTRGKRREELKWIFPGSWINHNFKVWIGHVEDNTAWDLISDAREALTAFQESLKTHDEREAKKASLEAAWEEIYAAEGSDWFWWYGEEHSSLSDENFDNLFRNHIKKVYRLIDKDPPDSVDIPISSEMKGYRPPVRPSAFISPIIDGEVSNYFEWLAAGRLERHHYGTSMHKESSASELIESILYGFSSDDLYFRFDYAARLQSYDKEWSVTLNFMHPLPVRIIVTVMGKTSKAAVFMKTSQKESWSETTANVSVASDSVVELKIPVSVLGVSNGEEIRLYISINGYEKGMERWPGKGFLIFERPSDKFEEEDWIV